jgi:hypothetical protein
MAKDAGLHPAALEVVIAKDGTLTFRILGEKASPQASAPTETAAAKEWQDEIEKLKSRKVK